MKTLIITNHHPKYADKTFTADYDKYKAANINNLNWAAIDPIIDAGFEYENDYSFGTNLVIKLKA